MLECGHQTSFTATRQDWDNKVSHYNNNTAICESQHRTSTTETADDSTNHFIYITTQQVNLSVMLGAAQLNKITTWQGIPSVLTMLFFNSTKLVTGTMSLHMSDNQRKDNTV